MCPSAHQLHELSVPVVFSEHFVGGAEGFANEENMQRRGKEKTHQITDLLEGIASPANSDSFLARNNFGRLSPAISTIPALPHSSGPPDIAHRVQYPEKVQRHEQNAVFRKIDDPA